jgi:GNAT superfamily N-acetyltransferase
MGILDPLTTGQRLLRLASIRVQVADPASDDARHCLAAYVAELRERFPEGFDQSDLVQPREVRGDAGVFLVAREDGSPMGCGALRALTPVTGEIRHMWVDTGARGLGVGRRLLAELEREASARRFEVVRLGTHPVLIEAIQMYRDSGYAQISRYGDDPHAHYWFEKRVPRLSLRGHQLTLAMTRTRSIVGAWPTRRGRSRRHWPRRRGGQREDMEPCAGALLSGQGSGPPPHPLLS